MKRRPKLAPPDSPPASRKGSATGTYVYDKDSDAVVKISDRIPGVSSKSSSSPDRGASAPDCGAPACGRGVCGSGSCAGD